MKSDTFLSVVMTMAEAAHTFDIPYHRFCDQHQNCTKPHIQAHVDQQLLMPAQEKVLCDWVKYLGNKGQPMLKNMLLVAVADMSKSLQEKSKETGKWCLPN